VQEARLERTEAGLVPEGEGWFVVNAREARWSHSEELGSFCQFEGSETRFPQLGINLNVLEPGQPGGMYHGEDAQEDFLVLAGECLLLIEGEERTLRAWDFVHCPAWTEHVFVGAGDGPCLYLGVGARPTPAVRYPVSEVAQKHGAGVAEETDSPRQAYAGFEQPQPGPFRHAELFQRGPSY
jgi:uncharacterized cupin superfamily protein